MQPAETLKLSEFLRLLRKQGELHLFAAEGLLPQADKRETLHFLELEFEKEYPKSIFKTLYFDAEAAWWATELFTLSSGYLVQRELNSNEAIGSLPEPLKPNSESAILSADLILCFFPDLFRELRRLNPEDELIGALEKHLNPFWFSLASEILPEELPLLLPPNATVLNLMFADRIFEHKNLSLAGREPMKSILKSDMGLHAEKLWPNFYYAYCHAN